MGIFDDFLIWGSDILYPIVGETEVDKPITVLPDPVEPKNIQKNVEKKAKSIFNKFFIYLSIIILIFLFWKK